MALRHLTTALLAGICAYLVATLFWAPYSSAGYDRFLAYQQALEQELLDIRTRRDQLLAGSDALRSDDTAVAVLARSQDLYEPDAQVIRLQGSSGNRGAMSPGAVIRRPAPPPDRRTDALLVAGAAALIVLTLSVATAGASQPATIRRASR